MRYTFSSNLCSISPAAGAGTVPANFICNGRQGDRRWSSAPIAVADASSAERWRKRLGVNVSASSIASGTMFSEYVASNFRGRVPSTWRLAPPLLNSSELRWFWRHLGGHWYLQIPRPSASAHWIENNVRRRCLDGNGFALKDRAWSIMNSVYSAQDCELYANADFDQKPKGCCSMRYDTMSSDFDG